MDDQDKNSIRIEILKWFFSTESHREESTASCRNKYLYDKNSKMPTDFVAVDFETLYAQRISACSIGMVKYKDGVIVDRYYSLIRPPEDFPGKNGRELTWIHGFTWDDLKNEKTFAEIHSAVENFIEGLPLVAHNASVEKACFQQTIEYYGITSTIPCDDIYDTLVLARQIEKAADQYEGGPGMHSLDIVCQRFGVPVLNHHNALDDAEMCGNLFVKFADIWNAKDFRKVELQKPDELQKQKGKYTDEDLHQIEDLDAVPDNPFKDKYVVLTGFASALSQEYGHVLHEKGAHLQNSVSGKTQILICGPNAGPSKKQKALEIGATILTEQEFLDILYE